MHRLLPTLIIPAFVCSCSTFKWQKYERALAEVKTVAVPGRKLGAVKVDLEKHGYEVSKPHDSNYAKEGFDMDVYYGANIGFVDSVRYTMDLPTGGPPIVIVVNADRKQTVTGVHE